MFFLGVLRDALGQCLASFPIEDSESLSTSTSSHHGNGDSPIQVNDGETARASGYLFGLNAMGMCVLKLPEEVLEVEGRRLAPIISKVSTFLPLERSVRWIC